MQIPLIDPILGQEEIAGAMRVMSSRNLSTGPEVLEFEAKFAEYIGVEYAVAVNSGTSALELALNVANLKKGASVITPSFTFAAGPNSIFNNDNVPYFVDIKPDTYTMDVSKLLKFDSRGAISPRAIMPMHAFGYPVDMVDLLKYSAQFKNRPIIIEDCAEAAGAFVDRKRVGSIGDIGIFSFTASKNMTTGEGGMITTNNSKYAQYLRQLRDHGFNRGYFVDASPWYRNSMFPGHNYRMPNILAAIGIEQLKKLDDMNSKRIKNAGYLSRKLNNDIPSIITPQVMDRDSTHVYQMYVINVQYVCAPPRDNIISQLRSAGIEASAHFDPPCHQHVAADNIFHICADMSVTNKVAQNVITLPIYPTLTEREIDYMVSTLKDIADGDD